MNRLAPLQVSRLIGQNRLFIRCADYGRARKRLPNTGLPWKPISFRYLGVNVFHTERELVEGNLDRATRGIRSSLQFWVRLPLSPRGKVAVVKMLVLPRLLYLFTVLPVLPTKACFRGLRTLVSDLVWGTGRKRVSVVTLQRPLMEGDLGVPTWNCITQLPNCSGQCDG